MKGLLSNAASRAWLVVALVGAVVVVLVLALQLIPRLTGAQDVLDDAGPVMTDARVAGDRVGIDFISKLVDTADPLVTAQGGGAGEVGALIGVVSKKTGLTSAQILAVLKKEAPHTTALLQALPLSGVTAERPGLYAFLGKTLKLSEDEVQGALKQSFPRLWQTLQAAPPVTDGWNDVQGLDGMTRFDGTTAVKSSSRPSRPTAVTSRRSPTRAASATSRGCCSSWAPSCSRSACSWRRARRRARRRVRARGASSCSSAS